MEYFNLSVEKTFSILRSDASCIASAEAEKRLAEYGLNKLPEKKKLAAVALFFRQLKNPLIYILFAALIISLLTAHWVDAIIVTAVIYISSLIGFFQEYKAGQALERLNKLIRYDVKVLRNGAPVFVSHEKIVPGDVILISSGDKIPADARLIEASNFSTMESSFYFIAIIGKFALKAIS